ncbi:MAG: hypothetical protein M3198_15760 [Actinomycetota bacterium]|nr:hypothetical protein [Actinomycetota bacterium]
MSETYTAAYERDGDVWFSEIMEEPEVKCSAPSLPKAREQIREALAEKLNTAATELRVVDNFRLPTSFRKAQESVRSTRTDAERERLMEKMTGPIPVKEWADDLGISQRDPRTVEWLKTLEGVELNVDNLCAAITHAEDMSRWGEGAELAVDDVLGDDQTSK